MVCLKTYFTKGTLWYFVPKLKPQDCDCLPLDACGERMNQDGYGYLMVLPRLAILLQDIYAMILMCACVCDYC